MVMIPPSSGHGFTRAPGTPLTACWGGRRAEKERGETTASATAVCRSAPGAKAHSREGILSAWTARLKSCPDEPCPDDPPTQVLNQLLVISAGILLLVIPHVVLAQRGAEPEAELTLAEFRTLLRSQAPGSGQSPEAARRRAEESFFRLLAAQGRVAAAQQSVDRLSGWTKAAEARLAAQSAPPLEVEMLRFAEAKTEARLERFEAERRRALRQANQSLGREADSPLLALTTPGSDDKQVGAAPETGPSGPNASLGNSPSSGASEFARRREQFEQELLPQARDLIGKMYQNYLFGGVSLSALLWQEEQVYETELQYRLLLVEAERELAAAD